MAGETGGTTDRILNKLQYAVANKAVDITTVATADRFLIADVSDDYEIKFATTAQVGALNAMVSVTDAATYTVLAADSGKTHVIPNLTADCTLTLPAAAAGLEYRFIYGGVAADAQDWIIDTTANANFYLGGLVHLDTDAGAAGIEVVAIAGDGNSNSILTVLTPTVGTEVYMVCDGTNWFLSGRVVSIVVPTFADQA